MCKEKTCTVHLLSSRGLLQAICDHWLILVLKCNISPNDSSLVDVRCWIRTDQAGNEGRGLRSQRSCHCESSYPVTERLFMIRQTIIIYMYFYGEDSDPNLTSDLEFGFLALLN